MDDDRLIAARKIIGEADRDMARLFVKRMDAVRTVAAYKRDHGLPVLDEARERAVIERGLSYIEDGELRDLYAQFLRHVMDISKAYQRRLMEHGEENG